MAESSENRTYIAIDLKSFYASVECVERGLDPLKTNLVVADPTRTEKTICLAVSPSLKAHGISGRARLFEVVSKVKEVNGVRRVNAKRGTFAGRSYDATELEKNPDLELDYIVAPPRMNKYMDYSARIFDIYLRYIAPEDMHVYSIDECFMDVTKYLDFYGMTANELCMKMIKEVLKETGITATGGIGTNMYLCKIAMDVMAKHIPADENGVRIAALDEMSYRKNLWDHRPLTDFWRLGRGYEKRLAAMGMFTMGDIARCSVESEELLYKEFGVNAELLIDHAWGHEPVTIEQIKNYRPEKNSVSSGQVLKEPYDSEKTRLVVWEMADSLALDLVRKSIATDRITLTISYDRENLRGAEGAKYSGRISFDPYGRPIPYHAHGTTALGRHTNSTELILDKTMELFDRIIDKDLLSRRINVTAENVIPEREAMKEPEFEQMELSFDVDLQAKKERDKKDEERERRLNSAVLEIKKRFGKNAMLKGSNLKEGATMMERNGQVGGHKA